MLFLLIKIVWFVLVGRETGTDQCSFSMVWICHQHGRFVRGRGLSPIRQFPSASFNYKFFVATLTDGSWFQVWVIPWLLREGVRLVEVFSTRCYCRLVYAFQFAGANTRLSIDSRRDVVMSSTPIQHSTLNIRSIWIFIKTFYFRRWKWIFMFVIGKVKCNAKLINSSRVRQFSELMIRNLERWLNIPYRYCESDVCLLL